MTSGIQIFNLEDFQKHLTSSEIKKILKSCSEFFKITSYNVNIICLPKEELRALKKQYFDMDVYTDVITFPLERTETFLEGEIYLSPEMIESNANEYKVKFSQEFARILIHGFLHLLDYDDLTTEGKSEMTNLENKLLEITGFYG